MQDINNLNLEPIEKEESPLVNDLNNEIDLNDEKIDT